MLSVLSKLRCCVHTSPFHSLRYFIPIFAALLFLLFPYCPISSTWTVSLLHCISAVLYPEKHCTGLNTVLCPSPIRLETQTHSCPFLSSHNLFFYFHYIICVCVRSGNNFATPTTSDQTKPNQTKPNQPIPYSTIRHILLKISMRTQS